MTKSTSSAKSTSTTARPISSVGSRKIVRDFMSGASVLALVVAGCALLPVGTAHADPSITWSGDVSPTPDVGTTNWMPTDTVYVRNGGTLNVSGGATIGSDQQRASFFIGTSSAGLSAPVSTLNVDGVGSIAYLGSTAGKNYSNSQINVTNGGYINASIIYVGPFNPRGSNSGLLVSGQGSKLNAVSLYAVLDSAKLLSTNTNSTTVKVLDGGSITAGNINSAQSFNSKTNIYSLNSLIDGAGSTINFSHYSSGSTIDTGVYQIGTVGIGQEYNPASSTVLTLSNGGALNVATLAMNGGVATVNVGAAAGQAPVAAGLLNVATVQFNGDTNARPTLNFNQTDTTKTAAVFSGLGNINQIAGDTVFTGDSKDFTGSLTISGGALHLGDGGATGSIAGNIVNNGTLIFDRSGPFTADNLISGTGKLVMQGTGTLTLTEDNTYSGGTEINAGAIAFDSSGELGSGAISLNGGALNSTNTKADILAQDFNFGQNGGTIDTAKMLTLNGILSGTGAFNKTGTGELVLNGDGSAFIGLTSVNAGGLTVHGSLGGDVTVASAATLGGDGTIMGNATIGAGGILAGNSGQQMTFAKNLTVDNNAVTNVALGGFSPIPLFDVKGDLAIGGKINVTNAGGFGAGIYNIYHYDGVLTNNGVTLGTLPNGVNGADLTLQTNAPHQINLVNAAGGKLGFWDGATTTAGGTVHGGDGTWTATGTNWTNLDGSANAALATEGFAVFMGAAGDVKVDDAGGASIKVKGMQFAVDGYKVLGDGLELVDGNDAPKISVGDGTQAGTQMTAIIDSTLSGSHGLDKVNYGTLILAANNTYTGITYISQGTLQLGNGGAEGSVKGDIHNNGTLTVNLSDDFTLENTISGTGNVVKQGNNTITISNYHNTFSGGFTVEAGTVVAGASAPAEGASTHGVFGIGGLNVYTGATVDLGAFNQTLTGLSGGGTVHMSSATLSLNQNVDSIFSGQIMQDAGNTGNAVAKNGTGTLALTGDNHANVSVGGGTLQIGNGGTTGSVQGNIENATTVAFNRTDGLTYDGVISGTGLVSQLGTGTTILTGENTYTGGTTIRQGTLQIGDGHNTGSILGNVTNNGSLAFNRSDDTSFTGTISGMGNVAQNGSASLTLTAANTFTGGLKVNQGTVKAGIADSAFGAGDVNVAKAATADLNGFNTTIDSLNGDGKFALNNANLTIKDGGGTFDGAMTGTGSLILDGSHQWLGGTADYTGATTLRNATLGLGANNAFSVASKYTLDAGSAIDMGGFSTTIGSIDNAGNIMNSGHAGSVLHVAGNFASHGGGVTLNTVLGGDNSATDMLKVDGNVSGKTMLTINNDGGLGAQTVNGIKIIDVAGQTTGGFSLAGDYYTKDGQSAVVAGAYAYTLRKNSPAAPNDGDWYLTNVVYTNNNPVDPNNPNNPVDPINPPVTRYSAGVPIYEGYAQNMQALNKLPTLQQRVGNRYWTGENGNGKDKGAVVNEYGVWARVEGAHNRFEPNTTTARMKQDIDTVLMQAGVDGQFYEDDNGKLIAGFNGQYGHAKGDISSFSGDGSITTDSWSLGATATWYGNNGFYVDTQGQVSWFDNDLESSTANIGLANGTKATGYGLSVEAGQRIDLNQNWSLTPQAQLAWSSINADDFNDVWNSRVSLHDGNSLMGRIGLAANYRNDWKGDDGLDVNTTVYGIANLYQEMLSGSSVNVSGVSFDTNSDRTWGGVGFGGTYAWADNKYAVYGEGSINTSLNNFANSYSYKATTGFKVKW